MSSSDRDRVLRFLDTRLAHGRSCRECSDDGWIGACGWNDTDPLRPPETDQQPDLTDIATHASGVWLTALVVVAGLFEGAYLWSRS